MALCGVFAKTSEVDRLAAGGRCHQLDDMAHRGLAHLSAIVAEKLAAG